MRITFVKVQYFSIMLIKNLKYCINWWSDVTSMVYAKMIETNEFGETVVIEQAKVASIVNFHHRIWKTARKIQNLSYF
jgi:hypothetical protein